MVLVYKKTPLHCTPEISAQIDKEVKEIKYKGVSQ